MRRIHPTCGTSCGIGRGARSLLAALATVACAGCLCSTLSMRCPTVDRFAASAHTVCPGRPVTLTWKAAGETVLTATPGTACEGPVAPQGGVTCMVDRDTLFTLEASRAGGTQRAEQEVAVVTESGHDVTIGDRTECAGDYVVAIATLPPDDWDAALRVERVMAHTTRRISVAHEGRVAILGPRQPRTDVFRGTRVAGKWVLGSPVAKGESCESRAPAPKAALPPDSLTVSVVFGCQ